METLKQTIEARQKEAQRQPDDTLVWLIAGGMLLRALLALQTIKGNRTQYVAYYTQGMSDRAHQARELLDDVERALEEEQLCVWFQPQYDAGGQLAGAEALVRWQHPE